MSLALAGGSTGKTTRTLSVLPIARVERPVYERLDFSTACQRGSYLTQINAAQIDSDNTNVLRDIFKGTL